MKADKQRKSTCPACDGTGSVLCPRCDGIGRRGLRDCVACNGTGVVTCSTCTTRFKLSFGDQKIQGEITGGSGAEVAEVAKLLMKEAKASAMKINISRSTIGVLNSGEFEDVQSISVNIVSLAKSGHSNVAEALKKLTESITSSTQLASQQRAELLDHLEELSKQATLEPDKRMRMSVIRSIMSSISSTIQTAGGLAEVWSTWGPAIMSFFGITKS